MPQHHDATRAGTGNATPAEIEAAARQYVRKISGVQKPTERTVDAFERAVTRHHRSHH